LELARRFVPGIVILDLGIQDMTGHEFLVRLRADRITESVPVVVMGFDATRTDIQSFESLGLVTYLRKPLNVRDFIGAVARSLTGDGPRSVVRRISG
jgi:two-component system cell cycle response regulator DivK